MNFILSISVGVVKLTGPAGTGKTRLLQQLETELQAERQETLLFLTPPTSIKDLHDTITKRLKLDNEFGFNKALIHHIIAKPYDQQRLVVVFDNAELIDIDVLLAIALFRNVMHNGQPIVSIVLCGSEALNTKLEDASYRPLVADMLLSYEINPLTREQLQAYGNACADIHRLGKLPLKNGVLTELLAESKGLPGPVPELLKKLKDKLASGAIAVKSDEAPAPVAAAAAKPVAAEAPAPKNEAAKPAFRLFGKSEPKPEAAAKAEAPAPKAAKPSFRLFGKPEAKEEPAPAPVAAKAAAPAPAPVAAKPAAPAPAPVAAKPATPAPERAPAPAPAPVSIAKPAPSPAKPVPATPALASEAPALSDDERLILASRAEKEDTRSKFKVDIDWSRYKPVAQRVAMAAVLLVVVIVGWPRVAPTVGGLYANLTGSGAPEPAAPPVEVAATETPAPAEAPPSEAPPAEAAPPAVAAVEPAPVTQLPPQANPRRLNPPRRSQPPNRLLPHLRRLHRKSRASRAPLSRMQTPTNSKW
jgi:hypothetical protein